MSSYPFDTKVVIVLRDDLAPWQRVNAAAFLSSGVAAALPQIVGEKYADADGNTYLPMLGQPVFVLEADKETIGDIHQRAVRRDVATAVFTADLFSTGNDEDNRAAVAAVRAADLDLVGVAVHAPRNVADRVVKGAARHP